MINQLRLAAKIVKMMMQKRFTSVADYARDYDRVAATYSAWVEKMSVYSEAILPPPEALSDAMHILDAACGTGSLSQRLLSRSNADFSLFACDISEGMLKQYRAAVTDLRAHCFQADMLAVLNTSPAAYDMILCGWALAYVDIPDFFRAAFRALKPGGTLRLAANGRSSASIIEPALRQLLMRHPDDLQKYTRLTDSLPESAGALVAAAQQAGFRAETSGEGEAVFTFDSAADYLAWQEKTGAIAGVRSMFANYDARRDELLTLLEAYADAQGQYLSRHSYVYAVLKKTEH